MTKGTLELSVTQDRPVLSIEAGAVAYLRPSGKSGNQVVTIDVPVGLTVTPVSVDLAEGWWSIDVVMPSGERLQDDVEITSGPPRQVELLATDSPRETLIWQQLAGQVSARDHSSDGIDERAVIDFLEGSHGISPESHANAVKHFNSATATFYDTHKAPQSLWSFLEPVTRKSLPDSPKEWINRGALTQQFDDFYLLFYPSEVSAAGDRALWVEITSARGSSLIFVPTRWSSRQYEDREASIMVRRKPDERGVAEVSIQDTDVASMLGYLIHGRLAEADRLADRFQGWLFEKVSNPLAAAAGGYVLLANRLSSDESHWHQWIRNLNNWFPELPDGAVLEGYMCLHGPEGVRDLDRAAECFGNAYDRGVPAYAVGLSWLRSGLQTFAASVPGLAQKAETVALVSRLVETNHAFTAFRLW